MVQQQAIVKCTSLEQQQLEEGKWSIFSSRDLQGYDIQLVEP